MSYWQGKVALVTGGSAGLGLAIAERLAREGARVAIAARGAEALERAAAQLARHGGEVLGVPADITQDADVERLLQAVIERFGRLDLCVNCAGRSARGDVLGTTPDDFRQLVELNLLGTVRVTRAAAPYLLASGGHLVQVASLAAKSAVRYMGAYPASKFALAAYTQQLRLELGPRGVKVLLACPGPIAREQQRDYRPADSALPASAAAPGAGVKLSSLSPERVAAAILRSAERGRAELILPGKARLLFILAAISPKLGDWLIRKMT